MVATPPVRTFVPPALDPANWSQLRPLYESLIARPVGSAAELEAWLADVSELAAVVDEYGNRRYIEKSCDTESPEVEQRYMHFVEEIEPLTKPPLVKLKQRYLASPYRAELEAAERYQVLGRQWAAEAGLFREANVPLETEVTKLVTEYDKLSGAMMVEFGGRQQTMQQMARYLERTDRAEREAAWVASARRRMVDRAAIEVIFDRLLGLRAQIARNAGLDNYRSYAWLSYKRFDYSPEQCLRFADAIEAACVPLARELDRQRQADLKLAALRPWDANVDPANRPPLEPFAEDQTAAFVEKTRQIIHRLSPALAEGFDSLRQRNNLDLGSRRGKQPGGYQCTLEESREPFIFMNAAGAQRDVETLLHEAGHAFHALAARDEPLMFLRSAPMEFCEVASMSMELLGSEHLDVFYADPADVARARRTLIEGTIRLLPWIATIDRFQHWLYTHDGHSPDQRTSEWIALLDRFGSRLDWSGFEDVRAASWQRQLHLFHSPFYYVEYGIAQLGALQLWMKSKEDPRRALANYRAALALGGTKPLPDLFAAAGIRFDFSTKTLGPLMDALGEELASLPR